MQPLPSHSSLANLLVVISAALKLDFTKLYIPNLVIPSKIGLQKMESAALFGISWTKTFEYQTVDFSAQILLLLLQC
jgi:hypothetical protein